MKQTLSILPALSFLLILSVGCQKKISDTPAKVNGGINASNAVITREYYILPSTTDPAITTFNVNNFASVQEGAVLKNVLYVFLPGTNRNPTVCRATTQKAASLGYHSIGLMYNNNVAGNPICSPTNDTTCHRRLRLEVIDGVDRHPSVAVNPTHSIINRLYKLLVYLNTTYPAQGWGQYILSGKPNWSKIIVGGHSQGAALAGVLGKFYPVKKVLMFSMIDFLNNGKIPDWENNKVGKEKYIALTNTNDELVPYGKALSGWYAMGIYIIDPVTKKTSIRNVDWFPFPYDNVQTLVTTVTPNTTMIDKYHNGTGVDAYIPKNAAGKYIYDKAWEYMLNR